VFCGFVARVFGYRTSIDASWRSRGNGAITSSCAGLHPQIRLYGLYKVLLSSEMYAFNEITSSSTGLHPKIRLYGLYKVLLSSEMCAFNEITSSSTGLHPRVLRKRRAPSNGWGSDTFHVERYNLGSVDTSHCTGLLKPALSRIH